MSGAGAAAADAALRQISTGDYLDLSGQALFFAQARVVGRDALSIHRLTHERIEKILVAISLSCGYGRLSVFYRFVLQIGQSVSAVRRQSRKRACATRAATWKAVATDLCLHRDGLIWHANASEPSPPGRCPTWTSGGGRQSCLEVPKMRLGNCEKWKRRRRCTFALVNP